MTPAINPKYANQGKGVGNPLIRNNIQQDSAPLVLDSSEDKTLQAHDVEKDVNFSRIPRNTWKCEELNSERLVFYVNKNATTSHGLVWQLQCLSLSWHNTIVW